MIARSRLDNSLPRICSPIPNRLPITPYQLPTSSIQTCRVRNTEFFKHKATGQSVRTGGSLFLWLTVDQFLIQLQGEEYVLSPGRTNKKVMSTCYWPCSGLSKLLVQTWSEDMKALF